MKTAMALLLFTTLGFAQAQPDVYVFRFDVARVALLGIPVSTAGSDHIQVIVRPSSTAVKSVRVDAELQVDGVPIKFQNADERSPNIGIVFHD